MSRTKILILITVFIDVIGIGIIVPILPFYVGHFNSSPFLITSLFSVYAALSFISAPIIGAVSDKVGRKLMLIMSIFSTSVGWFVFAFAPNIFFLFIGRIIDGAAAGNLPIAQAFLVDISKNDKERTANLGLIGAVFGLAFTVGPLIGSLLSTVSSSFPFIFVGGLSLVNGILAIFFLPETHTERAHIQDRKISINPFKPIARALKDKKLVPNYSAWFLFGLAISSFQSVFALYVAKVFNYGPLAIGIIFTCTGLVIALNQAVAFKHFWLVHFKESTLELYMLVIFAVSFVLLSVPSIFVFFLAMVGTTFGQSILRTVMNSQIVAKAEPSRKGEVLGITSSITSLSMTIGPLLAGYFFILHHTVPFLLSSVLLAIAFAILYHGRKMMPEKCVDEKENLASMI